MLKGKSTSVIKHNAKMMQAKGVKQGAAMSSALAAAGQAKGKKVARKVAQGDEVPDKAQFKSKTVQPKFPANTPDPNYQ